MRRAPLIVTPGEPAGIGCEIALKAWQNKAAPFCLIDSPDHVRTTAKTLGLDIVITEIDSPSQFDHACDALQLIPLQWNSTPQKGFANPENADQVISAIERAANWCLCGDAAGMVTNPIHKSTLYEAGFSYPGHTEFLASFGTPTEGAPVMMLACETLRVVPVTVHIALKEVFKSLSRDLIIAKARLLNRSLRQEFGISQPRIAVCGLNPHAGENGTMGREDIDIIQPAIDALRQEGVAATGPHPADSLFHPAARQTYDAVLGMYHDQVLIPLKTIDFYQGVNITLGLEFVRTSPDHGTGLDIAGKAIARADSLIASLKMADQLALAKGKGTAA